MTRLYCISLSVLYIQIEKQTQQLQMEIRNRSGFNVSNSRSKRSWTPKSCFESKVFKLREADILTTLVFNYALISLDVIIHSI